MNRAHRICQKTLKLTDRKLRVQPYLKREPFLLFNPSAKKQQWNANTYAAEEENKPILD